MKSLLLIFLLFPGLLQAYELKVLTWNVFMIPKPIFQTFQDERTESIAKEFLKNDYDLIVLQEAFFSYFRSYVGNELYGKFPYQDHLGRKLFFKVINSGVFILSRHPFQTLDWTYFTACTMSDCLASKGALLIEMTLPDGKKVQVAGTHLQAWDSPVSLLSRKHQMSEIKELFDLHAREGVPQILMGDLNMDGNSQLEYPEALRAMGMSAAPLSGAIRLTSGLKIDCYETPGPLNSEPTWLDHVWINPRGSKLKFLDQRVRVFNADFKQKNCSLSDHYAVEAILQL